MGNNMEVMEMMTIQCRSCQYFDVDEAGQPMCVNMDGKLPDACPLLKPEELTLPEAVNHAKQIQSLNCKICHCEITKLYEIVFALRHNGFCQSCESSEG